MRSNNRNNLTVRYQQIWNSLDNQGVGGFNLPSQAYRETQREQTAQTTETATLNPRLVTETRFQYLRASAWDSGGQRCAGNRCSGRVLHRRRAHRRFRQRHGKLGGFEPHHLHGG